MSSFMNVRLTGALNDQVNFRTFGSSLLLLFRLVTSAGCNDVLDPLMNTRDCTPPNGVNPGDCGDPILAVIYFVLLIFLIFLGMMFNVDCCVNCSCCVNCDCCANCDCCVNVMKICIVVFLPFLT